MDLPPGATLPYSELLEGLTGIKGTVVLFLDTCHAGALFGRPGSPSMDVENMVNRLSRSSTGIIVYASSTGTQLSLEAPLWKNGAFTKSVIEGLQGAAQFQNWDYITASMLEVYVKERVKDLTANRQWPTVNMPLSVPDLLFARIGN